MKLISTNTTVALAGLLLLIPTAYGSLQYGCELGDLVSMELVLRLSSGHNESHNRDGNPAIPTREKYTSTSFTKKLSAIDTRHVGYLIQVYGDPPQYQLSQYSERGWGVCALEESH
ncbi:putative candidate secreted effector protein [Blumeria hordei DH14]|uniref:Putative candidate secreted effector protein n=1 Tax=Blumeria graminis f. sp. hordei (strain DH14) TaxID=546991 RepID=N1J5U7_BLUG1|nr:putative candidate secreted effector protein [Blumeria hordei DH14]